ncbi:MAG: phage/plasmid primase, P4 family [Alphaproteobacteria bacterium]|nr:phage/plasmid primase, P4 family [Alphaproteobacteria bacterium]
MTVNLITGEDYPPRREDYCTKIAPVRFEADATCPLWHKFLARITDDDEDLQEYLARVVGYWLTGHTHEHVLFFLYGTGGNGKSVFIDTIADMLGDYATTAPPGTFLSSRWDRHPTEIAGLRAVRLVVADEVEEGRHWNEARIKQLTGGGKVKARFMRQDFFEFTPQFKICVVGNNKPGLRSVDEAIRRRLHLIPFTVTIMEQERDRHLKDKLKAEWSGILNWALAGCKAWREGGLEPPKAVLGATDDYLAEEDTLASWISDRCHLELDAKTQSSVLFRSFCEWCEASKERTGTQKAFSQKLRSHGYHRKQERTGTFFYGLRL